MIRSSSLKLLGTAFVVLALTPFAPAQNRVRFPSVAQAFPPTTQPYTPPAAAGTTPWVPLNPAPTTPGVTLGAPQPFDPYSLPPAQTAPTLTPSTPFYSPPQTTQPYPTQPYPTQPQTLPVQPVPNFTTPPLTSPPIPTAPPRQLPVAPQNTTPWVPVPSGGVTLPNTALPSAPFTTPPANVSPTLPSAPYGGSTFPPPPLSGSVLTSPNVVPVFPNGLPWQQGSEPYQRLFQGPGFVYTFLAGDPTAANPDQLQINEVDVFTTAVFNNFGHSPNGLRVTPGFTVDFLQGPSQPGKIMLPSTLYSAYIDTAWRPQLTPQYHADLNFAVGVYSDFERFTTSSIRYTGRGLGVLQITPTVALKLGIEYLDRNQIKLLPAGGVLWEPDENTRYDFYFPRPKFSRYWTTWGNSTIWWHLGAEYGGGAWALERVALPDIGTTERIDINDIRVFTGIEWDRLNRSTGLLEIGYVFDRDIYVANHRDEDIDLDSTFMARAGFKF